MEFRTIAIDFDKEIIYCYLIQSKWIIIKLAV